MKALTVHQPYASMLADGFEVKPCENRPVTIAWRNYRGPIAIHAGKSDKWLPDGDTLDRYPTSAVLCKGHLICVFNLALAREAFANRKMPRELTELGWTPQHFRWLLEHEETCGPLCLVITDRVRYEPPIPAVGKQGLWEWNEP